MFFTSEAPIPFNTIEDVMISYPTWKLKMMAGNDVYFQYKALEGDTLYKEFFQRTKTKPKKFCLSNCGSGFNTDEIRSSCIAHRPGKFVGPF